MGLFGKKTIEDNIKDFNQEYPFAQLLSLNYLTTWFEKIFEKDEFKIKFSNKPNFPAALAGEVMKYLSAYDPKEKAYPGTDMETNKIAKKHAQKWANDVMEHDKDFCKLRVQTLRMELNYKMYINGADYFTVNPNGKRIADLLNKFGGLVPESPTPKEYTKMINEWRSRST